MHGQNEGNLMEASINVYEIRVPNTTKTNCMSSQTTPHHIIQRPSLPITLHALMNDQRTHHSVVLAIAPANQGADKSWVIDMSSSEYFLDWNEVSLSLYKTLAGADQVTM